MSFALFRGLGRIVYPTRTLFERYAIESEYLTELRAVHRRLS